MNKLFALLLFGMPLLMNADNVSIPEENRRWHYSTTVYDNSFANAEGWNIWRVFGNVNTVVDAPKTESGEFEITFKIKGFNSGKSKIRLGLFEDFYPDPSKRSTDNGIYLSIVRNGDHHSLDIVLRRNQTEKTLTTKAHQWLADHEYTLKMDKSAGQTTFYLDGEKIFTAPALGAAVIGVGVDNAHIVFTGNSAKLNWRCLDVGIDHVKSARQAGITTLMVGSEQNFWLEDNRLDFSGIESRLKLLAETVPDSKLILRINMRSSAWIRQNPAELQVSIDLAGNRHTAPPYNPFSFASKKWRHDFYQVWSQLVQHFEKSEYTDRIIGYCPMVGDGGEWSYGFRHNLSDYSEPQRLAFIEYAKAKYDNDLDKLNAAWKTDETSFESIQIPNYKRRLTGDIGIFFDPVISRKIIDFNDHFSKTVSSMIMETAAITRKYAPGKLNIFYYGYHFMPGDQTGDLSGTGHRALSELLNCPDIDVIGGPQMYYNRNAGGAALAQTVPKSLEINGKYYLDEDDTRTFQVPIYCPNIPAPYEKNLADSVAVLLRDAGDALFKKNGILLWMEMGNKWFDHPDFIKLGKQFDRPEFRASAQPEIAFIVSDKSYNHMAFTNALSGPLLARTMMHAVTRIGAPFDTILLSDFAKAPAYKLYIFADCCIIDGPTRGAITGKLSREKATALWMYAPGIGDEQTLSLQHTETLTGFSPSWITEKTTVSLPGDPPLLRAEIAPMLYLNTPSDANNILTLKQADGTSRQAAIMQQKKMPGGWTSIWTGSPVLTASHFRQAAATAEAHIFTDTNDQVLFNGNILLIHASSDGQRTVKLPGHFKVNEFLTGNPVATDADNFPVELKKGETASYICSPE